jgi:hypothetical protein
MIGRAQPKIREGLINVVRGRHVAGPAVVPRSKADQILDITSIIRLRYRSRDPIEHGRGRCRPANRYQPRNDENGRKRTNPHDLPFGSGTAAPRAQPSRRQGKGYGTIPPCPAVACRLNPLAAGTKKPRRIASGSSLNGAPGEIRTPDHLVRSQVLYPTELRALMKSRAIIGLVTDPPTRGDGGERGIRTLDGALWPHTPLAGERLQPLGHLSSCKTGRQKGYLFNATT